MSHTGFVVALESEARTLRPTLSGPSATMSNSSASIAVSGIGSSAAERAASSLFATGATSLVSWGYAGGLDPRLPAGTVLLADKVMSEDGHVFATDNVWRQQLHDSLSTLPSVTHGTLLTVMQALGDRRDKAAALQQHGALAVDMESAAIGSIASRQRLPFLVVRVVLDTATDTVLPTMTASIDSSGEVQFVRLLAALARAPHELLPLVQLVARYRIARRTLSTVARVGRSALCQPATMGAAAA